MFVHCAAAFDQVALAGADAATWRHVQAVKRIGRAPPDIHPRHGQTAFGRIVFITSDTFWGPPARCCSPTSPIVRGTILMLKAWETE